MIENAFHKFYWGFLLILIDFRIQGIDILPDFIGFILFAGAFNVLLNHSEYFSRAKSYNIPMIVLSLFTFYEPPVQEGGIFISPLGPLGLLIGVASIVLGLLVVYNLFMGIKEMAEKQELMDIYAEAEQRWGQYLMLQLAAILAFVMIAFPPIAVFYVIGLFIAFIILAINILTFMKRCEKSFSAVEQDFI